MFTGIVEELGTVRAILPNEGGARLEITASTVLDDAALGASIAVNGCCLTVVELHDGWWAADAVTETLDRTALGALTEGAPVNLERPVRLADRLGGHVVQGHVDGVATLTKREPLPDGSTRMTFSPPHHLRSCATWWRRARSPSTASASPWPAWMTRAATFAIAVIPHTLAVTTLGAKQPGDPVNLEVDVLAKYVERLLTAAGAAPDTSPNPHT